MSYTDTIKKLIEDQTIESVLRRDSKSKDAVTALQNLLHELGFDKQINYARFGADGIYGTGTTKAVKAFAVKNAITSDGETVTRDIGSRLIELYNILDDLRHLQNAIEGDKADALLYTNSPHKTTVVALQTLLNALGFSEELKWARYKADGDYGDCTKEALKAFAQTVGIESDGTRLSKGLAIAIVNKLKGFYGDDWVKGAEPLNKASGELSIREVLENNKLRVYISFGGKRVRFTKFKKGVYFYGNQGPADFIKTKKSSLISIGLNESAINVMLAVAENEGNLDAINTWDNSFLSFGMFQWTIGSSDNPGELPALLKKIKATDDGIFQKYYGQYGLDIVDTGAVYGFFSLEGKKVDDTFKKGLLRSYEWAFYFWLSGQDPLIQSVEIKHALSRINIFYRSDSYKIKGYYIADLVKSEYGVSLLLDNHVNRPGYVKACIEKAMEETGLTDPPEQWGTDEEGRLIEVYLKIRSTYGRYPMTHAQSRAKVTKKYLDNKIISKERGSFKEG